MAKIPEKFTKGKARPVRTVGGLIKQLQELPKSLPVRCSFEDSVQVVVYNASLGSPEVQIVEPDA